MKRSRSVATRLSGRILLASSLFYIIAIVIISIATFNSIEDEASSNAIHSLDVSILQVENELSEVESALGNTYWQVMENIKDTNRLYHVSSQTVKHNSKIIGCAVALDSSFSGKRFCSPFSYENFDGQVLTKNLGDDKYNYYEMDWYYEPFHKKISNWCEPYYDEGGSKWLMTTYGIPLKMDNGEIIGVLTADLSLQELSVLLARNKPYPHSYIILLDKEGNVLVDGRKSMSKESNKVNSDVINGDLKKAMLIGKSGTMKFPENKDYVFVPYGPISNGWSIALVCPYREIFSHTIEMNNVFLIVSIIAMLLLFIFCMRIIRKHLEPVTQLSVSALNMAKGRFDAQLPEIQTEDELRKLHDSMEYMQKSITSYISELKSTTASNERMESELNIARKIQMGMVPHEFPNNLYAILNPAKEVGGDLYDFFRKGDKLYFAVGDVSGKGVPAALIMAITRAAFRFISGMQLHSDEVVTKINNSLTQGNDTNMFVTFFTACLDLNTGEMEFCNAGHNPMLVIPPKNSEKKPYLLKAMPNLTIGIMMDFPYQVERVVLEKGTRIILYTDGVTEAENIYKELFGEERLLDWAENSNVDKMSAQELVGDLLGTVREFTKEADQNDDITILGIDFA